ncbi:enoyl-CoA hydratase-related protein [Streptomyces sp. TUS-ST3]|uniref:enoyl-CoA hydratase-related protein n=1 Tax=Streptomyces sp. TUS-ST3 TaxID=3025591 RepID=UPI0032EA40B0
MSASQAEWPAFEQASRVPVITIATARGRARRSGNELAPACDVTFASRGNAVFGQVECGTGALPGKFST